MRKKIAYFITHHQSKADASSLWRKRKQNRTIGLIFGFFLMLGTWNTPAKVYASDVDEKTLLILTHNFFDQPSQAQRSILRQVGLLGSFHSVGFLFSVALGQNMESEIRSDALKALLAIDVNRYRPVLRMLDRDTIQKSDVVTAMEEIRDPRFVPALWKSLSPSEDPSALFYRMVSLGMGLWSQSDVALYDFSKLSSTKGNEYVQDLLLSSSPAQKLHWIYVAGLVRDEETHKVLLKMLEDKNEDVFEAVVSSLSQGVPDASQALEKTLRKEKDEKRRMKLIGGLANIGSSFSKKALQDFQSQANFDEKHLIEKILSQ
ncbi:MAG: HEAT repeat domain-containing protein [Bdellovibrionota bacterium]